MDTPIKLLKEHSPNYLSNLYQTVTYTYDGAGNRLTMTSDGILTEYNYNESNQLLQVGDKSFTYDGASNVIAVTSETEQSYYKYDGANRLTGVTYDDGTYAAYSYDALGRMVSREVGEYSPESIKAFNEKALSQKHGTTGNASNKGKGSSAEKSGGKTDLPKGLIGNENAKAYGVYRKAESGETLPKLDIEVENYDYLGQSTLLHKIYSEHGSPMNEYYQAGGEVIAQKMFGDKGRISPSKEATLNTNGGLMYYEYDGLGSVTALTDRHGDKIEDYRYDAFGNLQTGVTSPYNFKGYTGHLYDDKSSLVFMNARWYNPSVGRFMSKDTYRGEATSTQSLNQYAYVMNNPYKYVDPSGNIPVHSLSYYRSMSESALGSELLLMGEYWWEDYEIFKETGSWTLQQEQAHENANNIREALKGYEYIYKRTTTSTSPWELDGRSVYSDRIEYYYTRTRTNTAVYENYYGEKFEPTYVYEQMTQVESASQVAAKNQSTIESDLGYVNPAWNKPKVVTTKVEKGEAYVVENGILNRNNMLYGSDGDIEKVNKNVIGAAVNKGGVGEGESKPTNKII